MAVTELSSILSSLERAQSTPDGIKQLLKDLGYPILPDREQPLIVDTLLQQKDLREKVSRVSRLFSEKAKWQHPTGSLFDRDAVILLFEVANEDDLRSRNIFDITRYVVKFHLQTAQAILFFIGPSKRTFVVTAYTVSLDSKDRVEVRRLVVELDNITRTDVESLSALTYSKIRTAPIANAFEQALPYLKVGKDFFEEYHQHFQLLAKKSRSVFDSPGEAYGYLQRLLGRITFLHFLERKGWLDKDRAYLKQRLATLDGTKAFDFLYELFDALNTESRTKQSALGDIPFLNGSLFEKEPYSDSMFKKIRTICASLLPDILRSFGRYNFTISESTPLDKEVAVDPELLGSIFESMLPETERGDKGTFYTHQEEMLFMAREGLRCYLSRFPTLVNNDQICNLVYGIELASPELKIEPRVARELKETLRQIKILDPAVGSGGFLLASLQALMDVRERLNKVIGSAEMPYDLKYDTIQYNLFGVDIEYEAIELARLRLWLSLVVDEPVENVRPLPNLDYNLHEGDSLTVPEERQIPIDIDYTLRNALSNQMTVSREKFIRSHGIDKERAKEELENSLRKLYELETGKKPKKIPFSYHYLFYDVLANGGFDIVLMNPPYIQQEDIGKLPGQSPKYYKSEIAASARSLTQGKFVANKQSDISVYFHIRALTLLKDGGVAVVIATNKWLDVRYGVRLQNYLLQNSVIEFIFDSVKRSFSADVNTIITIIHKPSADSKKLENIAKFVNFGRSFSQVDGNMIGEIINNNNLGTVFFGAYRLTSRTQKQLYSDGFTDAEDAEEAEDGNLSKEDTFQTIGTKTYVGSKWGNLHLISPPVYFEILEKAGATLKRFEKLHGIKRGFASGNVKFYILAAKEKSRNLMECQNGLGHSFLLESKFCRPILRDTEDVSTYYLKSRDISSHVFVCREKKKDLEGTYALRYIKWAETSPNAVVPVLRGKDKDKKIQVSQLSTMASRADWYALPETTPAKILLPIIVKNRHVVPLCDQEIYSTNNYHLVYTNDPIDLWLFLNSTVFRFFMELNGRSEGAGALQLMVYEYKQCLIPDPLPALSKQFKDVDSFKNRVAYRFVNIAEQAPLELEQKDRRNLDDLILQQLGFSDQEERSKVISQIYDWLIKRINERLTKPNSAPESVADNSKRNMQHRDLREFT